MGAEVELAQPEVAMGLGVIDLIEKAREMDAAYAIAQKLAATPFVPSSYRGNVGATAAAIITGAELGLPLMSALQSIDVIDGRPSLRAMTLRALVLKAGHQIWVEESTPHRAIVCGRRRGSDRIEQSVWDDERARVAGLTGKANWQKYPGPMKIARGTADVARLIAPDLLLGLPYTSEEVEDGSLDDEPKSAPAKRAPARTARRRPLPVQPEEPALPDEPGVPEEQPEKAAEKAAEAPEITDAMAAEIEAELAAERAGQVFEEPSLDGNWGE